MSHSYSSIYEYTYWQQTFITLLMSLLTRSIPRSDFNQHAKEQFSFGNSESLLLILLLSEEYQTIAVF